MMEFIGFNESNWVCLMFVDISGIQWGFQADVNGIEGGFNGGDINGFRWSSMGLCVWNIAFDGVYYGVHMDLQGYIVNTMEVWLWINFGRCIL